MSMMATHGERWYEPASWSGGVGAEFKVHGCSKMMEGHCCLKPKEAKGAGDESKLFIQRYHTSTCHCPWVIAAMFNPPVAAWLAFAPTLYILYVKI